MNKMKSLYAGVFLISAIGLTGCASILNDKTQDINVRSSTGSPIEGTVNGQPFKGPGVVSVMRQNKDLHFTTTTDGCTKETVAAKSVDGKFFINILSGGAFGSSTDYGSDKMWKYGDDVVISCTK